MFIYFILFLKSKKTHTPNKSSMNPWWLTGNSNIHMWQMLCMRRYMFSKLSFMYTNLQEPTVFGRDMVDYISLIFISIYIRNANADCHLFEIAPLSIGRFCPTDAIPQRPVEAHECKYHCIQSKFCSAFNYNHTDKACTRMINPCAMALSYPDVQYTVFAQLAANQCYEWVFYDSSVADDVMEDRTIHTDRAGQKVSRMQKDGNDIVGYLVHGLKNCYGWYVDRQIDSGSGLLCQYLRVKEGCTLFWVPYIVGQSLPPRSVIGGTMANGDVNHVIKFHKLLNVGLIHSAGYFTAGASYGVGFYNFKKQTATSMHILIVLWGKAKLTLVMMNWSYKICI